MTTLRECPFCGGEAEIERYGNARQSTIYSCTECGCHLETGEEWDHGKLWNRRATDRLHDNNASVNEHGVRYTVTPAGKAALRGEG